MIISRFTCRAVRSLKRMYKSALLLLWMLFANLHIHAQGNALNFDGTNDYISLGNTTMVRPTSALTVGVWVYRANWATPALQAIISNTQSGGYSLNIGNDNTDGNGTKITVLVFRNSTYARPKFDCSKLTPGWHHIAFTYNRRVTVLYVDGVAVDSNDAGNNYSIVYHASNSTLIGAEADAGDVAAAAQPRYFSGSLDELKIYNVALTAAEVKTDMLSDNTVVSSGVLGHYKFNQSGTGTTLNTSVGTVNGIMRNFAFSGATSNWVESYAMVVPQLLDADAVTRTGFTAQWSTPTIGTIDNYILDVATDANFISPIIGSPFTVNDLSKEITGLNAGTTYYCRVRANKASVTGQGAPSATISTTTLADYTIPVVQPIANQNVCDGSSLVVNIPFNANDPDNTTFTAISSNEALVPNSNLNISGTGSNRTLAISTTIGKVGIVYITVKATNSDNESTTYSFELSIGQSEGYLVSTLAGGSFGFVDGIGANAKFDNPNGIAVDHNGNVYVTEFMNSSVRKVTAGGEVSTLAGDGSYSFADGMGTAAKLNMPVGLMVDALGDIYVADNRNNRIRKIATDGMVSTLTGSTTGLVNGNLADAKFNSPQDIVLDKLGNMFIVDQSNNCIRKITVGGVVSTFVTTGRPERMAIDGTNNLYVTLTDHRIIKITPLGIINTFAGSTQGYGDGVGTAAKFNNPRGIAVDKSGNVYVADYLNHRIRKITPEGVVTTLTGNGTRSYIEGHASIAGLGFPIAVAVDKDGVLYVAEQGNACVRKIAPVYTSCSLSPGSALRFNGTTDYVDVPAKNTSVTGSFTVMAWVKPEHATKAMHIFSTRESEYGFDMQLIGGNKVHADIGDGTGFLTTSADADYTYTTNQWLHVAYTVTEGAYKIYVNGELRTTGTLPEGIPLLLNNAHKIVIGKNASESTYFQGSIDEVRVYSTVLTEANIKAGMLGGEPVVPGNLIAYYNFNQTGNGLTDLSGNDYNGTLNGFATAGYKWVESYAMVVPQSLSATDVTSNGFSAVWAASAMGMADKYILEVGTESSFTNQVTGSPFTISSLSQQVNGLLSGTDYYYRVRANKSWLLDKGASSKIEKITTTAAFDYLSSCSMDGISFISTFSSAQLNYTATTASSSTQLLATQSNPTSVIEFQFNNGGYSNITSGVLSSQISLNLGSNTLNVKVTDGTTSRIYTFLINRVNPVTHYVTQSGAGTKDGSSWQNASDDLQLMINNSTAYDRVWVAGGTYKPNRRADDVNNITPGNARNAFVLKPDVGIYGGFAGSETALSERELKQTINKSILSADFDGNDVISGKGLSLDIKNNGENAFHTVVSVGAIGTARLDGFTITGGNASGNEFSQTTINGITIFNGNGGGILCMQSSPQLANLEILGNTARSGGGGVANYEKSLPTIENVQLIKNKATGWSSASLGGAMANYNGSSPLVQNIVMDGNTAYSGGAVYNKTSSPQFTNVVIIDNHATLGFQSGGGIYNSSSSSPSLTNVLIANNTAGEGGAIFNYDNSKPVLMNVTIANNTADSGGGIDHSDASTSIIHNSIIWGNSSGIAGPATVNYSLIQGGFSGTSNLDQNPLFVDPSNIAGTDGVLGTADDGFGLQLSSPTIAKGRNVLFTGLTAATLDLAGKPRVYNYATGGTIDLGAYEYQGLLSSTISGFADITKIYGDADFTLTAPVSNSNGAFTYNSNNAAVCTISGNTVTIVGAGTATITATQQAFGDYDTGTITLTLTVNKASQTISFAALDHKTTTSADFVLTATASSTLAISYTSSNTAVAEVYQDAGVWKVKIKDEGNTNITASQSGDGNYSAATDVVQQLIIVGTPLPVTLMSYTAKAEGNYAKLEWKTSAETNNRGFEVYRSGDDKQWVKIGDVQANDNSIYVRTNYYSPLTYTDKQPLNGTNYYKLVQIDNNGTATELGIRTLNFALPTSDIRLFPNPTTSKVVATFGVGKFTSAILTGVDGKVLKTMQLAHLQQELEIDLSAYPVGMYFIRLIGADESAVKKVIKQ